MLLSQTACKGLWIVTEEFPTSTMQSGIVECTATEDNKDDGRGCDCPERTEAPELRTFNKNASTTELEATIKKALCRISLQLLREAEAADHEGPTMHVVLDTNMCVIQPKEVGEPIIWCAPMHVVAKKS